MGIYRLWYLRKSSSIQGPFPEALVCRFIVLGRVDEETEVSLDGQYWRHVEQIPELVEGVQNLLRSGSGEDADWNEERAKAVLRWLDDRKSPDPRTRNRSTPVSSASEKRSGNDRRQNPENIEQHTYREWRGEFEAWLRQQRQRYGLVLITLALVGLAAGLVTTFYQPVNPIKVGLTVEASDCEVMPQKGVKWSNCVKDGSLLVGADLRGAELVGTSLKQANLSYADMTRANLTRADLTGANLTGARLGDAIWPDGKICAASSIGRCN